MLGTRACVFYFIYYIYILLDNRNTFQSGLKKFKGGLAMNNNSYHLKSSNDTFSYNTKIIDYNGVTEVRNYRYPIVVGRKRDIDIPEDDAHYNPFTDSYQLFNEFLPKEIEEKKRQRSLEVSCTRSLQSFYSIARANSWEYFGTLTFSSDHVDRDNYDSVRQHINSFLTYARQLAPDLKYILVPEFHSDGINYHVHGLFSNMGSLHLDFFKNINGRDIYNLKEYTKGFSTFSPIGDCQKAVSYCCKYISKDISGKLKGKRRFWASKNCKRPSVTLDSFSSEDVDQLLDSIGQVEYIKNCSAEFEDFDKHMNTFLRKYNHCNIYQISTE